MTAIDAIAQTDVVTPADSTPQPPIQWPEKKIHPSKRNRVKKESRRTPVIPIDEAAAKKMADAQTEQGDAVDISPSAISAYAGTVTGASTRSAASKIEVHSQDAYRLIGEMVVRRFDVAKITKRNKSFFSLLKEAWTPAMSASDIPVSPEPFHYTMNKKSVGSDLKDVDTSQLPYVYPYEEELAEVFGKNGMELTTANVVDEVQKLHYVSHVGDDPSKEQRKFDFRGNDQNIVGYAASHLLTNIRSNGIDVTDKTPRLLQTHPSINQKDAFYVVAGMAFEDRLRVKTGRVMKYGY